MVLQCGAKALPYIRFANSLVQGNGRNLMIRTSQRCYSAAGDTTSDAKVVAPAAVASSTTGQATATQRTVGLTDHKVNWIEKVFLVWGGKFKSIAEVPDFVSQSTLEKARNKARIKINLSMAVGTLFGCLIMVMSGKSALKKGETVTKMNEDFHKKMKEESTAPAK